MLLKRTFDGCSFRYTEGDLISETIKQTGDWEPHFRNVCDSFVNKNSLCIDVGANFGYHTITMSKIGGHVLAFEPMDHMASHLEHHLILNKCDNVEVYRTALGEGEYDSSMCEVDPKNIGNTYIGDGGEACKVISLDSLDVKPDFIKIDAQGYEEKIIEGAKTTLTKHKPILFFEVEEHHLIRYGSSSRKLLMKIMGYGYDIYRINTDYPSDHIAVPKYTIINLNLKLQKLPSVFSLTFGRYGNLIYENII